MLVVDQAVTSKKVGYYGSYVELAFIFANLEKVDSYGSIIM